MSSVVSSLTESDRATDLEGAIRLAETLMTALPYSFCAGVKVRLPLGSGLELLTVGLGISPALLETAVMVAWFVEPEEMPVRLTVCCPAFSLIVILEIGFSVGLVTGIGTV